MTAELDLTRALEMIGRKGPPKVAMCPACPDEVLVSTFRWSGAEFYCLTCRGHFGWLDPRPADDTPELTARCEAASLAFADEQAEDAGLTTSTRASSLHLPHP